MQSEGHFGCREGAHTYIRGMHAAVLMVCRSASVQRTGEIVRQGHGNVLGLKLHINILEW